MILSVVNSVEMLLNGLTAMGLLMHGKNTYKNTDFTREYLVKSKPTYMGHIIMHHFHLVDGWAQLHEAIKELTQKKAEYSHGWFHGTPGMAVKVTVFMVLLAAASLYLFYEQLFEIPVAHKTIASSEVNPETDREAIPKLKKAPEQAEPVARLTNEPEKLSNESNVSGQSSVIPDNGPNNKTTALESSTPPPDQNGKELSEPSELVKTENTHDTLASEIDAQVKQPSINGDTQNFLAFLKSLNSRHSRNSSMQETLKLWFPAKEIPQLKNRIESDPVFFEQAAEHYGLQALPVATDSDLTLIQKLNLPTIFTFYLPGHSWPKYLAVPYIDKKYIYFFAEELNRLDSIDRDIFLQYWSGEAFITWKNFNELQGIITERSTENHIKSLKKLLLQLGYNHIFLTENYDTETKETIKDIQKKYGLHVDGLVGPFTKIALYNESREFIKPSLVIIDGLVNSSLPTEITPITK
ncbi:peptidoglycan-binding protein [Thermodesulfobacteriota bacterium]